MPEKAFESDPYASIWLYRTTEQQRSKLGGLPNLPWWLAWPRRKVTANQLAGELARLGCPKWASRLLAKILIPVFSARFRKRRSPLHFLGQIDLSELPTRPLTTGGPHCHIGPAGVAIGTRDGRRYAATAPAGVI
jgi:hypothetical protein